MTPLQLRSRLQGRLLRPRLRRIQLLVCDVDGVLTDGGLHYDEAGRCLLYTSPSPRDRQKSRMPSSA